MLRRLFVIVSLLALVMAVASPALADPKDKDNGKGKPTATAAANPSATATETAFMGKSFQGTVTATPASDATALSVKSAKFDADLTIKTDGETRIHWPKGFVKQTSGTAPTLASFVKGDRVVVKLQAQPTDLGNLVARAIYLVPGQTFVHVTGTVTEATESSLKVQRPDGDVSFTVSASVQVRSGHQTAAYNTTTPPVMVGDKVTVVARGSLSSGEALTAYSIALHGQNNGKAGLDNEKGNAGVGQGNGKADDQDEDQNETENEDDDGQPHGKALGHDKDKPGKP